MTTRKIDTFVTIIADQNGGKSNQIRSLFEEPELASHYGGYPTQRIIDRKYYIHPDMALFLRLSSRQSRCLKAKAPQRANSDQRP